MTEQELINEIEALYCVDVFAGMPLRKIRFVFYFLLAFVIYFAWVYLSTWIGIHAILSQAIGVGEVVLLVFFLCECFYSPSNRRKSEIRGSISKLFSTTTVIPSEVESNLQRNNIPRESVSWYLDVECLRQVLLNKIP